MCRLTHQWNRDLAAVLQPWVALYCPLRAVPTLTVRGAVLKQKALRSPATKNPRDLFLTLWFPDGSQPSFSSIDFPHSVLWVLLLQRRKKTASFFFDLGKDTEVLFKSDFSQNFPIFLDNRLSRWVSQADMCCGPHPSLLLPTGVNVTMPSQPGMPPLSSTQLQIDPALQEFQLVDLSRRFLVHDSFWTLPEQFLGNKVRDGTAALDGEKGQAPLPCPEPAWVPLPLKLAGSRTDSTLGERGALAYSFRVGCLATTLKLEGMPTQLLERGSWTTPPHQGWGQCSSSGLPGHLLVYSACRTEYPQAEPSSPPSLLCCAQLCARHTVSARHPEGRRKGQVGPEQASGRAPGFPALIYPVPTRWTPTVAPCTIRCVMSWPVACWSQCSGRMWSSWAPDIAFSPEGTCPPSLAL